jgi:hypothetical protein
MPGMDSFANNWPAILVVLALFLVFLGLLRRLVKLAFFGALIAVAGLLIWPIVHS